VREKMRRMRVEMGKGEKVGRKEGGAGGEESNRNGERKQTRYGGATRRVHTHR
jgi:hypothetical protein